MYSRKSLSFALQSKCWRMENYRGSCRWCFVLLPVLNRERERVWWKTGGLKWLYSLTRFGFLTDEPSGDATSGWTCCSRRNIRLRWRKSTVRAASSSSTATNELSVVRRRNTSLAPMGSGSLRPVPSELDRQPTPAGAAVVRRGGGRSRRRWKRHPSTPQMI